MSPSHLSTKRDDSVVAVRRVRGPGTVARGAALVLWSGWIVLSVVGDAFTMRPEELPVWISIGIGLFFIVRSFFFGFVDRAEAPDRRLVVRHPTRASRLPGRRAAPPVCRAFHRRCRWQQPPQFAHEDARRSPALRQGSPVAGDDDDERDLPACAEGTPGSPRCSRRERHRRVRQPTLRLDTLPSCG